MGVCHSRLRVVSEASSRFISRQGVEEEFPSRKPQGSSIRGSGAYRWRETIGLAHKRRVLVTLVLCGGVAGPAPPRPA